VEKEDGTIMPKIKVSENVSKITTPCFKKLWRLYDRETGKAIADVVTLHNEIIDDTKPYEIFDPTHIWKRKLVSNFRAVPLREQLFKNGKCIAKEKTLKELQEDCKREVNTLWDEVQRFDNPHRYYVDLSRSLWDVKQKMLDEYTF
jgi:nicotinate phosphoribosyltransferase